MHEGDDDTGPAAGDPGLEGRKRLIDHFKRVYTIVAGLAITEAVRRLFPVDDNLLSGPSLWLFVALIATIVPIFHGGDRSLDAKYFGKPRTEGRGRVWFLVDVYALLVTAMLFVAIAEAVPRPAECQLGVTCDRNVGSYDARWFLTLIAATMAFDVVVLLLESWRERYERRRRRSDGGEAERFLDTYPYWAALNGSLALLAGLGAMLIWTAGRVPLAQDALLPMFPCLALFAILRTFADYVIGDRSLFP